MPAGARGARQWVSACVGDRRTAVCGVAPADTPLRLCARKAPRRRPLARAVPAHTRTRTHTHAHTRTRTRPR
eukprot:6438920-Alexandrium_andersonii.AAC.1